MRTKSIKLLVLSLVVSALALISSCGLDDINLTSYSVEQPEKDASYVGRSDKAAPIPDASKPALPEYFKVVYEKAPGKSVNIVLNGHKVGHYFKYYNDHALGEVKDFRQYLRQGVNTLNVEPNSFGPTVKFNLDSDGPAIIITEGDINAAKTKAEIKGFLRDVSEVHNKLVVRTYNITGHEANGALKKTAPSTIEIDVDPVTGEFEGEINVSGKLEQPLLYEFQAQDRYGYTSEKTFLADSAGTAALPLKNAVQVAIGDSLIQALRPLISSSIYETLQVMPMDVRYDAWNNNRVCWPTATGEQTAGDGHTINIVDGGIKFGPVNGTVPGKAYIQKDFDEAKEKLIEAGTASPEDSDVFAQIDSCVAAGNTSNCNCPNSFRDGAQLPANMKGLKGKLEGDITIDVERFYLDDGESGIYDQPGVMQLNEFNLTAGNKAIVDMDITNMVVRIVINPINGIIVLAGKMTLELGLPHTHVFTTADLTTEDQKVNIRLDKNDTKITFPGSMEVRKGEIWGGLGLTGLLDAILPLMGGMISDMTPDIINSILEEELQQIIIGGIIAREDNPAANFDMNMRVAELRTQPSLGVYDMYVALDSTVKVLGPDTSGAVKPMLGPIFVEDPVAPAVIDNTDAGSNMTVAINTNLINQGLNAAYATGTSHFTLHNGTTYYGGHEMTPVDPESNTKTLAKKGDTRIRLWPDVPPALQFIADDVRGNSQAKIEYESATLYFDEAVEKDGKVSWKNTIKLNVNFDLAVRIGQEGNAFVLGADGPPKFIINDMHNSSAIQVPQAALQRLMDFAMQLGGSLIANQFIVFDIGEILDDTAGGFDMVFQSTTDVATTGPEETDCIRIDEDGNVTYEGNASPGKDNKPDLVCHTVELRVTTETVGVEGVKGSNLFFQMTMEDKNTPPRTGLPHFDLDGDGIADMRGDNCAMPAVDILEAYQEIVDTNPSLAEDMDENSKPSEALENEMRSRINSLLATRFGANKLATDVPTADDYAHYNSLRHWGKKRANNPDEDITEANAGDYPWITMMYNNPSQSNLDALSTENPNGDRIGDLCEDDDDRDGIWASYDGIDGSQIEMPELYRPDLAGNSKYNSATHRLFVENDNCPSIFNPDQADTHQPIGVGDACNVRTNFVMLRSQESQYDTAQSGGEPMCLSYEGLDRNGFYSDTMHTMKVCDPNDEYQRWYMHSVNNLNLDAGVEFYTNATRNPATASRLVAYGRQVEHDCSLSGKRSNTYVDELRLVNRDNTALQNDNGKNYRQGGGTCNEVHRRGDPIWHPERANITAQSSHDEIQYPWIIRTDFNYFFGRSNEPNHGIDECMTYAQGGWGVDIDSHGQTHSCVTHGVSRKHRWSIWAGGDNAAWNGVW